jgi:hypothetical protein
LSARRRRRSRPESQTGRPCVAVPPHYSTGYSVNIPTPPVAAVLIAEAARDAFEARAVRTAPIAGLLARLHSGGCRGLTGARAGPLDRIRAVQEPEWFVPTTNAALLVRTRPAPSLSTRSRPVLGIFGCAFPASWKGDEITISTTHWHDCCAASASRSRFVAFGREWSTRS